MRDANQSVEESFDGQGLERTMWTMRTIGRGKVVRHTLLLITVFALVAGMTVIDQQLDEHYTTAVISAQVRNFSFDSLKPSTTAEIRRMTEVKRPPDQKRDGPDVDQWVREHELSVVSNRFSLYEREFLNRDREGIWAGTDQVPLQRRQVPGVLPSYPSSRRILAVSDSFGAAMGLSDPMHAWTRRLEQLLNDSTYTGAYQVDVIAEGHRNIYSFAAWLESGVVGELNPDAIVVSLHVNDVIPHGYELGTCDAHDNELVPGGCGVGSTPSLRKYIECRDGEGGFISAWLHRFVRPIYRNLARWGLERHCTIERIESKQEVTALSRAVINDPSKNPHLDEFKSAARRIIAAAGKRPVFLLPLGGDPAQYRALTAYSNLLEVEGFDVVEDLQEAQDLVEQHPTNESQDLWANPVDAHYNSRLTSALAKAAAIQIINEIAPQSQQNTAGVPPAMLSGYLPAAATIEPYGPRALYFGVGALFEQRLREDTTDPLPCAAAGRPHSRISLSRYALEGKQVKVTLVAAGERLTIAIGGLNADGAERRGSFEQFSTKTPTVFEVGESSSTLFIGKGRDGCPEDIAWNMRPFLISIEELPA
jgi:hypothetical protein